MVEDKDRNRQEFWKRKLMAFLHDPPCKAFDIASHEDRAKSFRAVAGIIEEEYKDFEKICDHTAASADRFPFPHKDTPCSSKFTGGEKFPFKHPLGGGEISFDVPIQTADLAEEKFSSAIGVVPADQDWDWQKKFYLYWRRWTEESAKSDERLAFVPADTRMPDHTIWTHMALTSAFIPCLEEENGNFKIKAALLKFSLGGVQEFITQARSTRDLVSGSYLISWLVAHAIKAITDEIGPDTIIYPSMRGHAIFDALHKDIFESIKLKDKTLWERINYSEEDLAVPSLPNQFLALVPAKKAEELAKKAENALIEELKNISEHCWELFAKIAKESGISMKENELLDWKVRWDKQVELFPQISWTATEWDEQLPLDENLEKLQKLATGAIPPDDRDKRYYLDEGKKKLNNLGFKWPLQYKNASKYFAARKNTSDFLQFITDEHQEGSPKDSLSGKEELIGSEDLWKYLKGNEFQKTKYKILFDEKQKSLGAVNLIKRLWVFKEENEKSYLTKKIGLQPDFGFESVPEIADNNDDKACRYVAIIAMDGDEMGKWVAGEKTPLFVEQLAKIAREYFEKLPGFDRTIKRPLSPSYHLQFSEALANFANHVVRRVVEAFGGQLIYSGGDDVLAMLPADKAIPCALTLRSFFRGECPAVAKESKRLAEYFNGPKGMLKQIEWNNKGWIKVGKNEPWLLMPGQNADVSCGIAIAHEKHPLQQIVKEAHKAEKRAKNEYGRSALAVSLLKHGGEIIYWGAKWPKVVKNSENNNHHEEKYPALELYEKFCEFRKNFEVSKKSGPQSISGRFTYALAERLQPYCFDNLDADGNEQFESGFNPKEVIMRELEEIFDRQGGVALKELCEKYLRHLGEDFKSKNGETKTRYRDFVKLFLTATFIERKRGE